MYKLNVSKSFENKEESISKERKKEDILKENIERVFGIFAVILILVIPLWLLSPDDNATAIGNVIMLLLALFVSIITWEKY